MERRIGIIVPDPTEDGVEGEEEEEEEESSLALDRVSREPLRANMSRVDGFDTWNPAAPGIGSNSSGMANRVDLLCPHHPAGLRNAIEREVEQWMAEKKE